MTITARRELAPAAPYLSQEPDLMQQAASLRSAQETLTGLLDYVNSVNDRAAAIGFFRGLGIEQPGEYDSPKDLFVSAISTINAGGQRAPLRIWTLTVESLGSTPNVLVIAVDHPTIATLLVCCKLSGQSYFADYEPRDKQRRQLLLSLGLEGTAGG